MRFVALLLFACSCGDVTLAAAGDAGNTGLEAAAADVDVALEHGNTGAAGAAAVEGPAPIACTSQTAIGHVDQCPGSCDKAICTTGDRVQRYVGCDRHSSGDPSSSYYCPPLGTVGGGAMVVPTVTCVAACP